MGGWVGGCMIGSVGDWVSGWVLSIQNYAISQLNLWPKGQKTMS